MKKIMLITFVAVAILCGRQNVNAQITLEASYTQVPYLQFFNHMTSKWMITSSTDIYLYNLNHSLFRHIIVPAQPYPASVPYITDDLFDNDSTNLEYLMQAYGSGFGKFVKIYREDGTLIFSCDTANLFAEYIVATDSGAKLRLQRQWTSTPFQIYSLPGVIPCPITCGGVAAPTTLVQTISQDMTKHKQNNPYPNPSNANINIPYELPEGVSNGEIVFYDLAGSEVKRYMVDRTFHDLVLSAADISAGLYYYQLQTSGGNSKGKKLIVVK